MLSKFNIAPEMAIFPAPSIDFFHKSAGPGWYNGIIGAQCLVAKKGLVRACSSAGKA
jgi:hypothetical protein